MVKVPNMCNCIHGLKPVLLMVSVQMISAGVNVLYKLAANDGMSLSVLIAYRLVFSSALIVPVALLVERKKRPKLTWMILWQAFCCALFGISLAQNLYIKALSLTSATFAAATTNLTPAITFLLALCFGMERLGWKTSPGAAKMMGTVLGVCGAMVLTFYKGVDLHLSKTNVNLLHGHHHSSNVQYSSNRVFGSLLAIGSCISVSIWLILLAYLVKTYPCPYSLAALTSTMGAIQSIVYGLSTERHWGDWKLGWNVRLLTVVYTGTLASGFMFTLVTWCLQERGPLFVSAFSPLMLVLVATAGYLMLDESLHLGSVLGSILIIFGLYGVLWGKDKELRKVARLPQIREPSIVMGDGAIDDESEQPSHEVEDNNLKHSSV